MYLEMPNKRAFLREVRMAPMVSFAALLNKPSQYYLARKKTAKRLFCKSMSRGIRDGTLRSTEK